MTDDNTQTDFDDRFPQPVVVEHRRRLPSLIWLVPLIAALIGLGLVVRSALSAGIDVQVRFGSAEGLESGKTEVKFKDVVVGRVKAISLSEDLQDVVVKIELRRDAGRLAVEDTRFWVVRPRIDTGGISGLGTLVSGVHIAMDVGSATESRRVFQGLETPPAVSSDEQGTQFMLKAEQLGSLGIGSPVYYRRIAVGRVGAYSLDEDGQGVTLRVFVAAPYDRFVGRDARFWNASGFDVSLGASGLQVNTESVASVIAGGVAFKNFGEATPAAAETEFTLYPSLAAATSPPTSEPVDIRMRFDESLRGLAVGAPIDFRGVEVGAIRSVNLLYDGDRARFVGDVVARIYPPRLGSAYESLCELIDQRATGGRAAAVMSELVRRGLRAQLRTGNLITGQLFVALDLSDGEPPQTVAVVDGVLAVPTDPGSLAQIQTQIADVVSRLSEVPFDDIGRNLNTTLQDVDRLLQRLDGELAPQASGALTDLRQTLAALNAAVAPDSGLRSDAHAALDQLDRAARSLRALADYLQRHPEALIRGRRATSDDATPVAEDP